MNKNTQLELFGFLKNHALPYTYFEHEPVFCVGEPLRYHGKEVKIPGAHTKNLFLQDQKSKRFFLVSVAEEIRVDLKKLAKDLGVNKFSFGKVDDLYRLLAVEPGSVTPFGLLFDRENEVAFVLDSQLARGDFVCFHPLQNNATLRLSVVSFKKFIALLGRNIIEIDIPCV